MMALTDIELLAPAKTQNSFWPRMRESLGLHITFIAIALVYIACFEFVQFLNPAVADKDPVRFFVGIIGVSIPTSILWMTLIQFYFVAVVDKSDKPIKDLWRRVKGVFRHQDTMLRGVPMFLSVLLFMYAFTVFKANIAAIIPFSWDVTFDQLDETLHFGTRPWEWLQPIFGNVIGTLILNVNYNLWFIVLKVFLVFFAFIHAPGLERTRFFIAFFLIWSIGGTFFATLFSSVGPCFYQFVVDGPNPYASLMQQLREFNTIVPIWAVDTQTYLWEARNQGSALGGVTAMPSMHNASTLLFVLATWNKSKLLRNLLIAHMALIFIGSVHLGWHYAVDAYLAWAIVLVLWAVAHWLARWHEASPKVQAFNTKCAGQFSPH